MEHDAESSSLYSYSRRGWTAGSAQDDAEFGKAIAKKGFIVANLNYTLAPTYSQGSVAATPYVSGPNDIMAFVKFLNTSEVLSSIHADANKISIGGISAGGHLALLQATRPDNTTNFKCVIDAVGPTDLNTIKQQALLQLTIDIVNGVFGLNPPSVFSPAQNIASFKANHLLIMHAEQDNLVPFAQATELAENVKRVRPGVDLTLNYWTDTNLTPTEPTHVINRAPATPAIASFLKSKCK